MDFCLALYPLYQCHQCLKKPRIAQIQHWLIFWQVWIGLHLLDHVVVSLGPIYQWIPLSNLFIGCYSVARFGVIVANYDQRVSYMTKQTLLNFTYKKIEHLKIDAFIENFYTNIVLPQLSKFMRR